MKLKVIDLREDEPFETTDGTCELCMGTPYMHTPYVWVLEATRGEVTEAVEVDNTFFSWGDSFDLPDIENVPHFGQWLKTLSFHDDEEVDFSLLEDVMRFYNDRIVPQ